MTDPTSSPRVPTRTWVKVLLAVSLTLNLMVLGVILGGWLGDHSRRGDHGPRDERRAFDPALGPFSRALPDPYRDRAVTALRDRAGDFQDNRAELAGQVSQMIALLRAEPFDAEALRGVMAAQTEIFAQRSQVGRAVVLDQIEQMSAADRAQLAERLETGFRRALDRARP
ncbi:periplasmic heavy metal sensor [Maritimibacter sp. UBA3975]|uniref:periplasmic heavy metal sensor n=1 Tax=Maritimibacter sp. UBA3975 TaxID=1946833 RepID=UPI000C0A00BB|nr:periplasmic heavy metal sensor [Maritimibacter sp. UBA3975]MAM62836.1 hypothetical protein [Maritimibacter sp.]|tara:strand:+ start:987 stop:1496 length:510 start_codon:yes stop_codon:yes gene_type:complete